MIESFFDYCISHFDLKKYKSFFLVGIYLSAAWIVFASYVYFEGINKYPKSYVESLDIPIYNCYEMVDDFEREDDAMQYAKSRGNEYQAKRLLDMGFKFLKPIFNLKGYLYLLFFPILFWLLFAYCFIMYGQAVIEKFKVSKLPLKLLMMIMFMLAIILLLNNTIRLQFFYLLLCIIFVIFHHLIKNKICSIFFASKAVENSKNK